MQSAAPLALFTLCIAVVSASTLPHSDPRPLHGDAGTLPAEPEEPLREVSAPAEPRDESPVRTGTASSATLEKQQTLTEAFPGTVLLSRPVWTVTNTSLDTGLRARLFLPRRKFTKTCGTISTSNTIGIYNSTLNEILETLRSNKDMLADGQTSTLQAILDGFTSKPTCDLSGLESGQTMILTEISNLGTELEKLDDILAAIATAKKMIIDGQGDINANIDDLEGDLDTAKTMILNGQAVINKNVESVSDELAIAKNMIIGGQTTITTNIGTLSSDLSTAKKMILDAITDIDGDIAAISTQISDAKTMLVAGQTTINNNIAGISTQVTNAQTSIDTINTKLDTLEQGQEKICDKIEALDVKLDTIIAKLMGGGGGGGGGGSNCPSGATLNDGKCFSVSSSRANFADATAACQMAGGTLVTMTAANEAVLYGLADSVAADRVWIGLTMASGSWEWQDGSMYGTFTDWPGAEPSAANKLCGEAIASSSTDGEWNDQSCTSNRFYICESNAT